MCYYPLYSELARLQIVLKSIWCWADGCLLSRLGFNNAATSSRLGLW